ncbi:MAG: hypothetical protein NC410_10185 [Oscillibacter sp.]|nr:hypothetical protein [Oscillibacter sp.]
MGVFDSVLGKIRKSVGNLTMYELDGRNIVRAKGTLSRYDRKSPLQLQQRARMKKVQELGWQLLEAIIVGFPAASRRQSRNRFVGRNIGLITPAEDGTATYDVGQLQLSSGEIVPPQVTASVDREEGCVIFVQERQALRPQALDDDLVYGVVWGKDTDEIQVIPLNRRAEPGINRIELEEELRDLPLELFAFAVSAHRKKASSTVYLGSV